MVFTVAEQPDQHDRESAQEGVRSEADSHSLRSASVQTECRVPATYGTVSSRMT